MFLYRRVLIGLSLLVVCIANVQADTLDDHPNLVLTQEGVDSIKASVGSVPSFDQALAKLTADVDKAINSTIDVPVPKDAGGGYTHEQHKRNYKTIQGAGFLYQITGQEKYLNHAKALFLEYAKLYPSLGEHPQKKEQSPGRLFWQSLNETVFLVYAIQGYDAIIDSLNAQERETIEGQFIRPMAKFLSEESPSTFNKVHNHGTWAVAGVGMTGYVLGDQELVDKALLGLDKSGNAGFIKQLDELFSPDGYYTEGPYYQRYALMPFVLFAKAIDNNDPQRKIFDYRDGVLLKAIYSTIQLSYNNLFFPINDAIKDKGINTAELVDGVSIAYGITNDPELLNIADKQGSMSISGDGLALAKGIDKGLAEPFNFKTMQLLDGANGKQGALAIFRAGEGDDHQALVVKNTSQGFGHGHFDKFNWLYFDNGFEIVRDYGAARFLNVESKYGGHYLPENNTWAKQTIAHNTLVVDQESHFNGDWRVSQKTAPSVDVFASSDQLDITSASIKGAYSDVEMVRTMAVIKDPGLEFPLIVDVMKAIGSKPHQYDLPIHFNGHITNLSFATKANTKVQKTLGDDNGYQFLWDKARGKASKQLPQVTWIKGTRFYSVSYAQTDAEQEFIFTQLGANDPDFNLRSEPAVIQRVQANKGHTFLSVFEKHGEYNPALEFTNDSVSRVKDLRLVQKNGFDIVLIDVHPELKFGLVLSYSGNEKNQHTVKVDGQTVTWNGRYSLFKR